jgi:hypothetical protein
MKFSLKPVLFGSTALGMVAISFSALAMPPHEPNAYDWGNVWWLEAYDDNSNTHNSVETRVVCFGPWNALNMHAEYEYWEDVWSSNLNLLLFDEKRGARQEGDQIFMVGDACDAIGFDCLKDWHDSRQWEITSWRKGHGHLQRWHETSGKHAWYNIELTRIPFICDSHKLTSYLSTVDIYIDNAETLEMLLSSIPECKPTDTKPTQRTAK